MKTILITAGGTSEPIDNIRSITNTGTGTLGSLIADRMAEDPRVGRILYVHGKNAVLPKTEKAECIEAAYTLKLQEVMRKLLTEEKPDVIIHSMAVSDYYVKSVVSLDDLKKCAFSDNPVEVSAEFDLRDKFNKIPSSAGQPVIFLTPTPKIIPELRQLAPAATIVGFKLLDEVAHEELLSVAKRLMEKNDCDFVLANDYETVKAGKHVGYLMHRDGLVETFEGKPAIAEGIAKAVSINW